MGGIRPFVSSSASTDGNPNLHRKRNSLPPGKFLIFHTNASFSGAYVALPYKVHKNSSIRIKLIEKQKIFHHRFCEQSLSRNKQVRWRTWEVRTTGVIASGGRGSIISTDVAELLSLNWDLAFTKYSVLLRLCFSTWHSTHIRGFTSWLNRYILQETRENVKNI